MHTEQMHLCSVSRTICVAFAAAFVFAPIGAERLASGLPGHPSAADYVRCTVRSFLVTPRPPVARRAIPRAIEASNRPERTEEAATARNKVRT